MHYNIWYHMKFKKQYRRISKYLRKAKNRLLILMVQPGAQATQRTSLRLGRGCWAPSESLVPQWRQRHCLEWALVLSYTSQWEVLKQPASQRWGCTTSENTLLKKLSRGDLVKLRIFKHMWKFSLLSKGTNVYKITIYYHNTGAQIILCFTLNPIFLELCGSFIT